MRAIRLAAGAIAGLLPAGSALACPYCAQERGDTVFLIAAISLLPLLLAAAIWAQVKRIERPH